MTERLEPSPDSGAAPVLALTADLMFGARVRSTAEAVSARLVLARSAEQLLSSARAERPRLIIVDLDTRTLDPVDLIRQIRNEPALPGVRVLAYVSHVREDLIEGARAAGADQVMARGAFARQLAAILAAPS